MTQTVQTQASTQTNKASKAHSVAPAIAMRKSCNPDGIGLSHYVLMDKKEAK